MCPGGMVSVVGVTEIEKSPAPSVAALLVAPVPPLVELTAPVVLTLFPKVVGVTFTVTAHELLAEIVPPLRLIEVLPAVAVNVPPLHVLVAPGVAATCRPAGKLSVTATPLKAVPVLGLVMVNVMVDVPPTEVLVGEKALLMLGGATTVTLAVLLLAPVPPSVELTAPVVLVFNPALVPVTLTITLQELLAASLPPLRLMLVLPAVAPIKVPPQVLETDEATASPDGRLSPNARPDNPTVGFGLLMLTVSVVEPFSGMLEAPNAFEIVGGATTVMLAVPALPGPVSVELEAVELVLVPADVPVTFTPTLHDAPPARLPPLRLKLTLPAVAPVTLPPQVLLDPALATCNPDGRLSVNESPVIERLELGLVIVNIKPVVPLSGIDNAPKAFTVVGGVATLRLAEAVLPVPPLVELTLPLVLL